MRTLASRVLLLSLLAPLAAPAAHAGEGATLTSELRSLFFDAICNAIPAADVDCAKKPTACFLEKNGARFAPRTGWDYAYPFLPVMALYQLEQPAQRTGRAARGDGVWDPVGQLSGLFGPGLERDQGVMHLGSEQITWLLAQVAPRPEDELCGAPAWRFYATLIKPLATTLADAYVFLQQKKALEDLDRAALVNERHNPDGRYEKLCGAFAGRTQDESEQYVRRYACEFWLRRAFVDQVEPIARAFATAVKPFDASLAKRVERATPKR